MLTIYGRTNSVNVQKVLWCLAELDVPYERIDAGLKFGKNNEPWYLELNPNGQVPLLVDGSFSLWESNTIVRYLAGKHGFGGLCPRSPETRALAERWMDWQLSTLIRPVSIVFQALYRTPPAERDAAAIARNTVEANRAMEPLGRASRRTAVRRGGCIHDGRYPGRRHRTPLARGRRDRAARAHGRACLARPTGRAAGLPAARHAAAELTALTRLRSCGTFLH